MTAPDPGLTDLIAAHWFIWDELECRCGWSTRNLPSSDDGTGIGVLFMRHLALVVEQYTNGRITELEAELAEAKDDKFYARVELNADAQWKARAEKAEATIARVHEIRCGNCNNPLSEGTGNCVSDAGRPHIYDEADLRAALEGEQQ